MLPLNLKRLTTDLLEQLARAMNVPTAASVDDLRQLISGKLEEMDKEPMNVQVVLKEAGRGTCLRLQNKEGEFLEAEPFNEEPPEESGDEEGDSEHDESTNIGKLHEALVKSQEENTALQAEVQSLKQKVKDMWQTNCK